MGRTAAVRRGTPGLTRTAAVPDWSEATDGAEFIHNDPDQCTDCGGYWQRWACTPPAEGAVYRVLEESWGKADDGQALRTIHRWEPW